VKLGVDRFLENPDAYLGGLDPGSRNATEVRLGLLTNDGARVGVKPGDLQDAASTRVAFRSAGIPLTHLFSPEHGLSASAPDGVYVPNDCGEKTGLPVTSLYGPDLRPHASLLEDMDMVLVDIQDVGTRFYTYLWTLTHLMEACAEVGVPMMILDRPNPLGGSAGWVEGPMPDRRFTSTLVGRWPIPVRHSLTLGEMALLLNAEMNLNLELRVASMDGWRRNMLWKDTGLPFHPPSPGIPSPESALLYPGLALLEATNVLEGRSTELAFRWLGAPWMDAEKMADALNRFEPGGVLASPHDQALPDREGSCPGILLEITEPENVRPVALGLRLLSVLLTLWPNRFSWAPYPTAVNPSGSGHLLRLLAMSEAVETLERIPENVDERTIEGWTEAPGWWTRAIPHLLYG
jgi:uncharacterized protein YbbC (DUF1343 family)